jgi:ElaB/YqjD/DUF883 family membrane-anchored ribosome-binding protein
MSAMEQGREKLQEASEAAGDMAGTAREKASDTVQRGKARAQSAWNRVRSAGEEAGDAMQSQIQEWKLRGAIALHPMQAMAYAFGAGLAIGYLLGRQGR